MDPGVFCDSEVEVCGVVAEDAYGGVCACFILGGFLAEREDFKGFVLVVSFDDEGWG